MTQNPTLLSVCRFICSGEFRENCYVVHPAGRTAVGQPGPPERPCWVIDPGGGLDEAIARVRGEALRPEAILLTHGHLDHLAGIPELTRIWPKLPIWIGRGEADALESPQTNLSAWLGMPVRLEQRPARLLDDGEELSLGEMRFTVLLAAGHSPGGLCYHCPQSGDLFTGDVLFAGSIGRTDAPGGDGPLLLRNIRQKLLTLPDETRVWPGHGPATTIGQERRENPFLAP